MRALPPTRLKTPAPDIGQRPAWQEKRWPAVTKSAAPAGQKTAPAAGLAGRGVDLFREFIADGFLIDPGIVWRPNNGNHRRDARGGAFGDIPARAEQWCRRCGRGVALRRGGGGGGGGR